MRKNLFKFSLVLAFVWLVFSAGQAEADDSATTTIRLQIKTNNISLYDQDIIVSTCADSVSASTTSVNAKCAVEQSGLLSDWSWWGDDAFLNSINGVYASDYVNNIYWGWFSNLEYGLVALNKHVLANGEKLLLAYNINPLKISVDNATPDVNATSTITLEQFGLDASWNPVWLPAASSTLVIDGQNFDNATGTYDYIATTSGAQIIYGKKNGYIDSDSITITAQEVVNAVNNDNNSNPPPTGGSVIIIPQSGGGSGGASTPVPAKVDLAKAIEFLNSKQSADGSYGSVLQTDWAAIALASVNPNGPAAQKLKGYLLTDPSSLVGMNPVSDYARRAMALMSLNISPYIGTKTNYINKIVGLYDGQQFGDPALYNDDIFALLVLGKAGYGADEKIILDAVAFIISKQQADGSWGGVDLTAAAVQALKPLESLSGVSEALVKARNFLFSAQQADGGFGNVYATPWVMQAIVATGENAADWKKNNDTPESYLALSQGNDGALNQSDNYEVNRLWATSYAIPAVQGKPWFSIMNNFVKEITSADGNQPAGDLPTLENITATSTLELINTATSTPGDLDQATSTPVVNQDEGRENKQTEIASVSAAKVIRSAVLGEKIVKPKKNTPVKKAAETKIAQVTDNAKNISIDKLESTLATKPADNRANSVAKKVLYFAGAGTVLAGILLLLKLLGFLL